MLKKLKELKTMIDISAKLSQNQKTHLKNEYALKTRMWAIVGRYKYNFKKERLQKVIANMKKINIVPKGYMYPELHHYSKIPSALTKSLAKKREIH